MNLYESIKSGSVMETEEKVEEITNTEEVVEETEKLVESTKKLIEKGERNGEPIAFINWEGNYQPFVVAINYNEETGSWSYGYYYSDEATAKKAFDFVCSGGNMHDFKPDEDIEESTPMNPTQEEMVNDAPNKESEEMVPTIKVEAESDPEYISKEFKKLLNDIYDLAYYAGHHNMQDLSNILQKAYDYLGEYKFPTEESEEISECGASSNKETKVEEV